MARTGCERHVSASAAVAASPSSRRTTAPPRSTDLSEARPRTRGRRARQRARSRSARRVAGTAAAARPRGRLRCSARCETAGARRPHLRRRHPAVTDRLRVSLAGPHAAAQRGGSLVRRTGLCVSEAREPRAPNPLAACACDSHPHDQASSPHDRCPSARVAPSADRQPQMKRLRAVHLCADIDRSAIGPRHRPPPRSPTSLVASQRHITSYLSRLSR